jgi:hypothetical protein
MAGLVAAPAATGAGFTCPDDWDVIGGDGRGLCARGAPAFAHPGTLARTTVEHRTHRTWTVGDDRVDSGGAQHLDVGGFVDGPHEDP